MKKILSAAIRMIAGCAGSPAANSRPGGEVPKQRAMFNRQSICLSWGAAVIVICLSTLGFAQESPKPPTDRQHASVSDSDLRAFAKAYVENQRIRQQYEPALSQTTDPDQYKRMQDAANAELKKSLAKQNLSIEKYNQIYTLVNNDEQLRAKVLKLVEEERAKSTS